MNIKAYEIRFFAVGTASKGGDAILVRVIDENDITHIVVIDGGYKEEGERIVDYVSNDLGLDTIDIIINTHPDIDHISGLISIFNSDKVKVKKLIMNRPWRDASLKSSYFKDGRITENSLECRLKDSFKKAWELEQIAIDKIGENNIVHPCVGNTYLDFLTIIGPSKEHYRSFLMESDKTPEKKCDSLSNSVRFFAKKILRFIPYMKGMPIQWIDGENTSAINETSVICCLDLPDRKILLTGDAGKTGISNALDYYEDMEDGNNASDFGVVQLPHHGSRKNVSPALFKRWGNTDYVISCPQDGFNEGHPSKRMINRLLLDCPLSNIYMTQGNCFVYTWNTYVNASVISGLAQFDEIEE